MTKSICFALGVLLTSVVRVVAAPALPAVEYSGFFLSEVYTSGPGLGYTTDLQALEGPGFFGTRAVNGTGSTSQTDVTVIPQYPPNIKARLYVAPFRADSTALSQVNITLTYYLSVTGPTPTVKVDSTTLGNFDLNNSTRGSAVFTLFNAGGSTVFGSGFTVQPGHLPLVFGETNERTSYDESFVSNVTSTLNIGEIYKGVLRMSLAITSAVQDFGGPDKLSTVFIDPTFVINASVPNANLYSFEFSEGVLATETPLPASLPLFATGLGALGFVAYRRKRKRVV